MSNWDWDWLTNSATKLWANMILGVGIGLLGAYGREQHEGRKPDRRWLSNRLFIMPFLALGAGSIADSFNLKPSVATFLAALMSLLAYDLVRVITSRALKKAGTTMSDFLDASKDSFVEAPAGTGMPEIMTIHKPQPIEDGVPPEAAGVKALSHILPLEKTDQSLRSLLNQLNDVPSSPGMPTDQNDQ